MVDGGPPALQPAPVVTSLPTSATASPTKINQSSHTARTASSTCAKLVTFQTRIFWKAQGRCRGPSIKDKQLDGDTQFSSGSKSTEILLTLPGEVRLWYESLRPICSELARFTRSI